MEKKKSPVWNHFTDNGNTTAKCGYCPTNLSFKGGSTANLHRHLKNKHPGMLNILSSDEGSNSIVLPNSTVVLSTEADPEPTPILVEQNTLSETRVVNKTKKQPSVAQYFHTTKPMALSKSKTIDEQLVRMIVKEYQPFSIVEDKEFVNLLAMLNPAYKLPNRKTLSSSLISQAYQKTIEAVKNRIELSYAVCITTDAWTSITNESYIAITAHFFDENLILQSVLLECVEYLERHTAENLSQQMQRCFQEWQIENKVVAVVSDNAANIKAAIRIGNWRHIGCFAHKINLIVQDAIKSISSTKKKIKDIVEHFKRSTVAANKLKNIQQQMGLPELKLKQDVTTRWNSTYFMLKRILEVKEPLIAAMALLATEHSLPTLSTGDCKIMESACQVLKIFEEITVEMSTENKVSISKILPLIRILRASIRKIPKDVPNEILLMVTSILDGIDLRFSTSDECLLSLQSTLLDPRFKKRGFGSEITYKKAYDTLARMASSVEVEIENEINSPQPCTSENSATKSVWDEFDKEIRDEICNNANRNISRGIIELDRYIQEMYLPRSADPLLWWEAKKHSFPRLYQIVRKRLCVLATSVPCERVFSKSGLVLSDRRSRLKPKLVSEILFLNANM